MKKNKAELDVDFIGGVPLTKDEEKLITDFISSRKQKAYSARASQKGKAKIKKA
jgi:hypothetical protein